MPVTIDHDSWNHSLPKQPRAPKITLGPIHDVLPFDGVRNASSRSAISHKIHLTYQTAANSWQPKVGVAESGAELAVAHEALISETTYDLQFQPCVVKYKDEDGRNRTYTHDLLATTMSGHRRLVFVRNGHSLSKPRTRREIEAIIAETPKQIANDLIVVNADDYSRQRRENLFRMHLFIFNPDPEADEMTLHAARRLRSLYYMHDLFPHVPTDPARTFASCYRLVGRKFLHANLNNVLWQHSKLEVVR